MKAKINPIPKNKKDFTPFLFEIFNIIIFGVLLDIEEKDLIIIFFNFSFSFFKIFKYRIYYENDWFDYIERFVWKNITFLRLTILNADFRIRLDDDNLILTFLNKTIMIKF